MAVKRWLIANRKAWLAQISEYRKANLSAISVRKATCYRKKKDQYDRRARMSYYLKTLVEPGLAEARELVFQTDKQLKQQGATCKK